ncbi:CCR4-NOT transcription complex subunit 7-like [Daktulosphaira vitifoliae]|uniref:CCR4-NOT transcription complex subunit 7-like n=1 Tax=Daktulosphaira vitifoliae TaxID=58002 RepID=UPI0021AB059E|nr:CCR4-NOT transcription complex subunit 7-like [Daktulosphaira vitifoliae]XP_050538684.1 CCR4-NOT transcription complex subunit 7-like [Daktulosphaira vitifoliae]
MKSATVDDTIENLRQLKTIWAKNREEQQTEFNSEARNTVRRTLFVDQSSDLESNDNILTISNENNPNWASYVIDNLGKKIVSNMPANSQTPIKEIKERDSDNKPGIGSDCGIKDVWAHNLEEEFASIRKLLPKYCYVAMDTEFPGVVARPIGDFKTTADYLYQLLRCNVDLLRIIQLGLSFFDEDGKTPTGPYTTWQFNFKFNLSEDMYAQDSIELLTNSRIQFKKHEEHGIEPLVFAEYIITSGLVLMDNIKWMTFHSSFDFGYLVKVLTDEKLPQEESEFFDMFSLYFPCVYDIKYLMKSCKNLKGGLQEVADQLELKRIGPQHQAGSDSLLTGMAFFKIRDMYFEGMIDSKKYCGHLYGLGITTLNNGQIRYDNNEQASN